MTDQDVQPRTFVLDGPGVVDASVLDGPTLLGAVPSDPRPSKRAWPAPVSEVTGG